MSVKLDFSTLDLMDALDLAVLIELEAQQRYVSFAEQIGHRAGVDAASIFEIDGEERGKARQSARRAQAGAVRRQAAGASAVSAIFDVEAPDFGAPTWNMSPLKAFQLALASEEKAFWFYDEAIKNVTNPSVRKLFTELRDEETEHVRMVKEAIEALPPGSDVDLENEDA